MAAPLVAGLDLGSTKTCAVIAEVTGGGDVRDFGAKILGVGVSRETGVRGGLVRDIEETTRSITNAMRDAQRMAGVPVPSVYCGIAGDNVQLRTSPGLVSVTGEEITKADVQRVNAVATAISLGQDRELLHSIPQDYRVNEQQGIDDPVGMTGLRLEVEMYLVSVASAAAQNVRRSVERAGFRLAQLVFEPLASSLAVLTAEERELGCALVDIGGNTTGLAVIKSGRIRHIASFPYAGDRITADVVHGLSVTQGDAERLKERWGVAYTPLVDPDETIELPSTPGQGIRQAKRELLAHIIHQRLDEVMGLVQKEIVEAGFHDGLPAGVILTGGVAQMPGVVELAREVFAMPARMGTPSQRISGLVDSVSSTRYAVAAGLVLYAARESIHGEDRSNLRIDKFLGPVKRFFQDFF
jgi:cell division protein FtsA